jgi:2,4-dienoyl-CoA reductase-like NADH-dependent reductase (Old Yellow Enzyme family)
MSNQPLFTPYRMGDLDLPNRIVMAPLTRMRAQPLDHVPTTLQAEYYAQRASAGLIIAEATAISPEGFGWADTPGLWTKEQVRGWRRVTDAVHAAGGRIIAQLWHTGAISHPELLDGAQPVSASNVNPGQISLTRTGKKPTVTPRSLTKEQIQVTVADFARAAQNAMEAGFNGVQILANDLYLISQFLNAATNLRKDEYGGSLENRSRFLFEVDAQRVGIKISPMHDYSCGRYQMIKQRLNQVARALLREFCAKDSLGDCQTMSEIDDNRDEIIWLQFRSDIGRSQEVPNKVTSVLKLLPMRFNKAFPDTLASKSSDLEFSPKHDPIMVSHQVGNGVPHFFQPLLA